MTPIATLAQLEAVLKVDLIATVGAPVRTFLTSTETIAQTLAANPTPSAAQILSAEAQERAAVATFVVNTIGALPTLAADGIAALANFLSTKLGS